MRVKRKTKKPLIISSVVITASLVAGLLWYYAFSSTGTNSNPEPSASKNKSSDDKQNDKKEVISKDSNTQDTPQSVPHEKEKDLPQLYEGENVNNSGGLTGVITAKSVMGDSLIIRNTIDQLVGSGTCTLTLTSGSKTVTKTAEIVQNPSSSTCAGFDVPFAELGKGSWNIEIKVSSGDKSMTLKETVNI